MHNYLEANDDVPWDDLQYNFGEIMYGGHITDFWDRRITNTYLKVCLKVRVRVRVTSRCASRPSRYTHRGHAHSG